MGIYMRKAVMKLSKQITPMCVNSQVLQITRNAERVISMWFRDQGKTAVTRYKKKKKNKKLTPPPPQSILLDSLSA